MSDIIGVVYVVNVSRPGLDCCFVNFTAHNAWCCADTWRALGYQTFTYKVTARKRWPLYAAMLA